MSVYHIFPQTQDLTRFPAINDEEFFPRIPFSRQQTILSSATQFDREALLASLERSRIPRPVAECLIFDVALFKAFAKKYERVGATYLGWRLKLARFLCLEWHRMNRPQSVVGYLTQTKQCIRESEICNRTPFSIR